MSEDKQDFLRRWSRLKRESAAAAVRKTETGTATAIATETPVPLPPLDSLTFESDFKAFMHAKVDQGVKRAALKKLFSDPRFNVMDGLDTYIDDYTKSDTIPPEMLARLERARQKLLEQEPDRYEERNRHEEPVGRDEARTGKDETQAQSAKNDVDPAQDPKAL
jgi:Protein of unknown function (DUF3306)